MRVNKTVCNLIRGSINTIIKVYKETLEDINNAIESINKSLIFHTDIEVFGRAIIVCKELIDGKEKIEGVDLLHRLEDCAKFLKSNIENASTLLSSLSVEGFKDITYGLPLITLTSCGKDLGYSYLMVSGIKLNANNKKADELPNELERQLFDYEKKMAEYIRDDLTISTENMEAFINLYKEYLDLFSEKLVNIPNIVYAESMSVIMVSMGLYIVYGNPNFEISRDEFVKLLLIFDRLLEDEQPIGKSVASLCMFSYLKELKRKSAMRENDEPKEKEEEVSLDVVPCNNPIDEYVKNGLVIKPCGIEEFEEILSKSQISSSKKEDLIDQMLDILATIEVQNHKRALEKLRKENLSIEEIELYNLARSKKQATGILDDIDLNLSLMDEAACQEDRNLLRNELDEMFDMLTLLLGAKPKGSVDEVSLFYIMDTLTDSKGKSVEVSKFYKSIAGMPKDSHKSYESLLNKILHGFINGDIEVQAGNLPYRIWVKGRNQYKIYYTLLEGKVVIIDAVKGEDSYQKIINFAKTNHFKTRLMEVGSSISKGDYREANAQTKLVLSMLGKDKSTKKCIN